MIQEVKEALFELCKLEILKGVFSMPCDKKSEVKKCVIRRLSDSHYQFERFTQKQAFHENVMSAELCEKLCGVLGTEFSQLQLFTPEYIYSLKVTSKGRLLQNRCKNSDNTVKIVPVSHNKEKNYIITAENAPPVFFDLGIVDRDGKIISSKYDKYRQICRFIELIDDVVSKDKREEYSIVDFGCGKSYLTFVVYHYMTAIMGKRVKITGLDLKKDVMNKCRLLAEKYNYSGMEFLCMDIKDYSPKERPDMVIALHACDVATDYAIYNAYLWQSDYIFSVPCCQHELNAKVKSDNFSLLCDYGLIKERFSALATDAIRAKCLEMCGYNVDVIEFINEEFSPKNLLLRAKRSTRIISSKRMQIYGKIKQFDAEFNSCLTLEKLVTDGNIEFDIDGKRFSAVRGKASMLLKDVMYLRKSESFDPVREDKDDTAEFICVYENGAIVYCARISDGNKREAEIFSKNLSETEKQYLKNITE